MFAGVWAWKPGLRGEVQACGQEDEELEPAGVGPGTGTALLIHLSCAVHGTLRKHLRITSACPDSLRSSGDKCL